MTASVAIDHVVALSPSPADAAAALAPFGLATLPGGRHAAWGTRNVVVPLADAYLEFLAVEDRAVAAQSPFGRAVLSGLAAGEGIWRIALRTDDMAASIAAMRGSGVACWGPVPGERLRPDGTRLSWRLAFPEGPLDGGTPPMLIAWDDPAYAPYGQGGGGHPDIARVAIASRAPGSLANWYERAFGFAPQEAADPGYGPAWRIPFARGELLICGGEDASPPVQRVLAEEGPGPFAVELRGEGRRAPRDVVIGRGRYRLTER